MKNNVVGSSSESAPESSRQQPAQNKSPSSPSSNTGGDKPVLATRQDSDIIMTGTDDISDQASQSSSISSNFIGISASNSHNTSGDHDVAINRPFLSIVKNSNNNSVASSSTNTPRNHGSDFEGDVALDDDDDIYLSSTASSRPSGLQVGTPVGQTDQDQDNDIDDADIAIEEEHSLLATDSGNDRDDEDEQEIQNAINETNAGFGDEFSEEDDIHDDDDNDDEDDDDQDDEDEDDEDDEDNDDHDDDDDDDEDSNERPSDEDNEDDDDDNDNPFRSANEQMLRSLRGVLGLPDVVSSMVNRIDPCLEAIKDRTDPSSVMAGLQELAEILLMTNEDVLNDYLPTTKVLDALVDIMVDELYESSVEIIIMTCRCLLNLLDANPMSLEKVSYARPVKALCEKLFEIQYIDTAELALTALRKISRSQTHAILENGGLTACLSYLDFFSVSTQRIATETVANTLASVPLRYCDSVKDAIPLIENILSNNDPEISKNVANSICGIIESFHYNSDHIDQLMTPKISTRLLSYVDPSVSSGLTLKPRIVKAIATIVKVSPRIAVLAIEDKLGSHLYQVLTKHAPYFDDDDSESAAKSSEKNTTAIIQSLIYADKDILFSTLNVFSNIYPQVATSEDTKLISPYKTIFNSDAERERSEKRTEALLKVENIVRFSKITISLLIDVYSSTVDIQIRRSALQTIIKVVSTLPSEVLQRVVADVELSLLLSSILSQRDHQSLTLGALEIATTLMQKLPDIYIVSFFRGGIIEEIDMLVKAEEAKEQAKEQAKANKETDEKDEDAKKDSTLMDIDGDDEDKTNSRDDDDDSDEDNEDEDNDDEDSDSSGLVRVISFYSDLSSLILSEAKTLLGVYNQHIKSRNFEQEMKRGLNELTALGEDFLTRENLQQHFAKFASVLSDVSEFELLCSHILRSLLKILTTGSDAEILKARKAFLEAFFSSGSWSTKSFDTLLEKLNESLSRFERFEVLTSDPNTQMHSSISSSLARQLRISLTPYVKEKPAVEGESSSSSTEKKKMKSIMISIQAIASFKAIDEFYKAKVQAENGFFGMGSNIFSQILASTEDEEESEESSKEEAEIKDSEKDTIMSDGAPKEDNSNSEDSEEENKSGVSTPQATTSASEPAPLPNSSGSRATEPTTSNSSTASWHLDFFIDDKLIPHDATVYGAIFKQLLAKEKEKKQKGESFTTNPSQQIWGTPHTIWFRKRRGDKSDSKEKFIEAEELDPTLKVPASFSTNESVAIVIRLLNTLFEMNNSIVDFFGPSDTSTACSSTTKVAPPLMALPMGKFSNSKLTAKLNRQLEEPLVVVSGIIPNWAVDSCRLYPFLFPFETRLLFLQSTSFGYSRLMNRLQQAQDNQESGSVNNGGLGGFGGNNRRPIGRLLRQKVRISRSHMLQSAMKVMSLYGASPYVLEVEFFDDVGTGLGPTLEFYATVSKQFTRKKLGIWRDDDGSSTEDSGKNSYAFSSQGLFPLPQDPAWLQTSSSGKKILSTFKSLGIFVARAMLDSRIIDLNFNPLLFRLAALSEEDLLSATHGVGTVYLVDKHTGKSLEMLQQYITARNELGLTTGDPEALEAIEIQGAKVKDLALDFTLPGRSNVELISGGANIEVTVANIEEYIQKVIEMTLGRGISLQIKAFKEGFSTVFPYSALSTFVPEELVVMCGQGETDWSYETLCGTAKADHGYTMDSRVVKDLFEIMSEFKPEQRKAFLQFVTGSPNLPIGGFKALRPPFTIVCRESEPPLTPDEYLPTVMTCVNYFKLPNYSSKEILRERILTAVKEGLGSFLLS